VYYIALVSKANAYTRRIGFYYPEDAVQKFNALRHADHTAQEQVAATLPLISLDQLDDRYTIDGTAAWRPTWVANDGTHTYVKLPLDGTHTDAPALFVQTAEGTAELVNFRVKGGYYIVDRVFEQAVLTRGTGRGKQTVTITHAAR
jgi:type IV secretion system protein VirB9